MNKNQFLEHIDELYKAGLHIIEKKNADYAGDEDPFTNFRLVEMAGLTVEEGILTRTLDKMARLCNVMQKPHAEVSDETVEDTIVDMINYLAILHAYRMRHHYVSYTCDYGKK